MFDRSRYEPKKLIASSLRAMVRDLDADALSAEDAVALVDWFSEVERLASAGKSLAGARVAASGRWQGSGERSAADWLAKRTGSTVGEARGALATAEHLGDTPATNAAFRSGALSPKQAEAVAAAAAVDPSAEDRLLGIARDQSLQKLRDESARVRAAAEPDPKARHERIHKGRFWRRWTDPDGARRGSYSLTPEQAAMFEAAAQPFIDARIERARDTGTNEPSEAHAADGLVDMARSTLDDRSGDHDATRGASPRGPEPPRPPRGGRGRRRLRDRRELIGLVNLESLRRGSVAPGETCEIAGVGPIPIETARDLFGSALLRIVIRDGVDIRTVVHTGRTANAVQETAVLVRSDGRCEQPTCDLPISEIDHTTGYRVNHQTTLDDLAGLCAHHHDLKTLHGHSYQRRSDGIVEWARPAGDTGHQRPPP